MPNEGRDLPVRGGDGDASVDASRKMRDPVLEVVVRDLHDVALVLNDRDLGALRQFSRRVPDAVLGDDGVRVDDEDRAVARYVGYRTTGGTV